MLVSSSCYSYIIIEASSMSFVFLICILDSMNHGYREKPYLCFSNLNCFHNFTWCTSMCHQKTAWFQTMAQIKQVSSSAYDVISLQTSFISNAVCFAHGRRRFHLFITRISVMYTCLLKPVRLGIHIYMQWLSHSTSCWGQCLRLYQPKGSLPTI